MIDDTIDIWATFIDDYDYLMQRFKEKQQFADKVNVFDKVAWREKLENELLDALAHNRVCAAREVLIESRYRKLLALVAAWKSKSREQIIELLDKREESDLSEL